MYPILLLILTASLFSAEYPTPLATPDAFMEQNIEYIKNKYQLPDEEPQSPKVIEDKSLSTLPSQPKTGNPREQKLHQLRQELDIPQLKGKAKKIDAIRSELHIQYPAPKHKSQLDKELEHVKKILHMDGEIEGEYSFQNTVNDLKKTLQIEGASSWGIPTFGLGGLFTPKPKKKKSFLSKINIFGDVQQTGQSLYKGMKYSGQSAQMMSGMMYNSSKMYNGMFGMFDDSPFNIFEEEEESSMFDFIESGNSIMELFD